MIEKEPSKSLKERAPPKSFNQLSEFVNTVDLGTKCSAVHPY
jgi:hypothetical protein